VGKLTSSIVIVWGMAPDEVLEDELLLKEDEEAEMPLLLLELPVRLELELEDVEDGDLEETA
jgi:hypothetical protein